MGTQVILSVVRAALCAVALVAALAPAASAQSGARGPGPFTNIRITEAGLLLTVSGGATPFAGAPAVFADAGAGLTRVDGRATVRKQGRQLLQRGAVGGVPIRDFFVEGEQRRIAVRNGDGATTEVDVLRVGDGFLIQRTNRAPGAAAAPDGPAHLSGLDVRGDRSVELALPASTEGAGYDVVVTLSLPQLPDGANEQTAAVVAAEVGSGRAYRGDALFFGSGRVAFPHVLLPEGVYTFKVLHTVSFGNPELYTARYTSEVPFDGEVRVSRRERLFSLAVPEAGLPPIAAQSIAVEGVEQFAPSAANRLEVELSLTSADESVRLTARRDAASPDPVRFDVRLPAGRYAASVGVRTPPGEASGSGHTERFSLGEVAVDGTARVALPPLVRVSGAVLDPNFALTTGEPPASGSSGIHSVGTSAGMPDGSSFTAGGLLFGFARSYSFFAPLGAVGGVEAGLAVKLGEPPSQYRASENSSGTLVVREPGQIAFDADRRIDVAVPALPPHATVTGRVVDRRGRPVELALVFASTESVEGIDGAYFYTFVVTNKRGEFALRLPRGAGYSLVASVLF